MTCALPERLRIGPYVYAVFADSAKLQAHEREKQNGYSGYSDHQLMEIVIDPSDAPGHQRETLWHEVKHCVINLFGQLGKQDDETFVRRTAPMELAVLRDNPRLVSYLVGADAREVESGP